MTYDPGRCYGRAIVAHLNPVDFDFWWPQRPEISWVVLGLRGHEELSTPYQFDIELICDDPQLDPEELLGTDCELLLDRSGLARTFFGVVAEVELIVAPTLEHDTEGVGARVRLVPAFRLLEHELDTRFFMGQTVIEILRDRLGSALAAWGRELDVESRITGQYPRRDYCVQFRESTFGFCSRLMEEEGIAYLFVADGPRERMVLIDDNHGYRDAELLVPGRVPIVTTAAEQLDRESIQAFEWRRRRTPNRVVTRSYSLAKPRPHDVGEAERQDRGRPVVAEQYLDGEQRQIIDDPVDDPDAQRVAKLALEQRAAMAERVLQRHTLEATRGRGRANAIGFAAGSVFELHDPPEAAGGEQPLLIVRVEHHGTGDGELAYHNHFECMPRSQPFRPARRTPKPRVYGVQTGVVVGRTGDEIHTDTLGRVRVEFHRDRSVVDGELASCWIPVAQMWAGNGYGTMIIPRVGMEVVVSFVDGDPDCPLVTGSVYHTDNAPPYSLPSELSKSTIKTRSTPGGDGFNELRIEDQDGREQIFVHAQRRMDVRVRGRLYQTSVGGREEVIGSSSESSDDFAGSHNTLVHGLVNHHVVHGRSTWVEWDDCRIVGYDAVEELQQSQFSFVAERSQLNAAEVVVEARERISHKAKALELAGSSTISVKAGGTVVVQSNNRVELVVGQSFIAVTPTAVEIGAETIRLNSGGGPIGRATDGQTAIEARLYDPVDALVADDGRPSSGGGGGGRGRGRGDRSSRILDPQHAPPMEPMKPPRPDRDRPPGEQQIIQIHWIDQDAWCSEPAQLWVTSKGYDGSRDETVIIDNQVDGVTQCVDVVRPSTPTQTFAIEITDLAPRPIGDKVEAERELLATLAQARTPLPIRFRFLSELPRFRYAQGRARFDLTVENHEVIIGGTIEWTRGWIHYLIRLDDTVPAGTGGLIGKKYSGSEDWRYCKSQPDEDGRDRLVYWNGASWAVVPKAWTSKLGTRLHGLGVWREGDVVKTQYGLQWPEPVPDTWTHGPDGDDNVDMHVDFWAYQIEEFWTGKLELQRNECRGHEHECCRYRVRCAVNFTETDRKQRGIILAQNRGRANADVWPYESDTFTVAHEFGHHLGNPDEYEGATSVDPTVNDDGAKAGIDNQSIMGDHGEIVRRRHFDAVCEAMALSVAEHTGKQFTYKAVVPTRGPA